MGLSDCILWTGRFMTSGYGRVWNSELRTDRGAHVVAWEKKHGPVPDGYQLHHTCEVRACVNVDHLELVTPKEHAARHPDAGARRRKTECVNGHSYDDPANVGTDSSGHRWCRACCRESARRSYVNRRKALENSENAISQTARKTPAVELAG